MDKKTLSSLIDDHLSQNQIAKHLDVSQSTVRYWLKKHDLKTIRGPKGKHPKDINLPRKCKCGETDPDKFYGNKRSICSKCHSDYQNSTGKAKRLKAIELLGGKCSRCDYNKYTGALDIHHLDSSKKDPNFKTHRYWSWERLKAELKHCILLCKNCHAEEHGAN